MKNLYNEIEFENYIRSVGFNICHKYTQPERESKSTSYDDKGLSKNSVKFLHNRNIPELWTHQYSAIQSSISGKNVCVTTSTSSGKSEIFQVSAIEELTKHSKGKVLAVYPMKALNRQQLERWSVTGLSVGKIDGDNHSIEDRRRALEENKIIVMTPDVIHSFLLGRLNDSIIGKVIRDFIREISLIIIDELHLYKGVFGTNSAYLFRRLNNIHRLLRRDKSFPKYITASATLPNAKKHSSDITGVGDFVEVGVEQDTSPSSEKIFYFVEADKTKDNCDVSCLISSLTEIPNAKSITFVEGRQKTGDMVIQSAQNSGVIPYRAGYESETVDKITESLHRGDFKGVVSTSALEIGIDIDGLNVAIIADMPHDKNSYQQRIGRVGRFGCDKSYVIIVRTNSFASKLLFDEFNYDIDKVLPNYDPALYLDDADIQNIHALCHIGDHDFCEYLQWKGSITQTRTFEFSDCFPSSFVKLCQDILSGQTTRDYDDIASPRPHHDYPIRFFGKQYEILPKQDENRYIPFEQISREMIATEGYEGAVRNTMEGKTPIKERVVKVDNVKREILVRREYNFHITTKARHIKLLVPNFKREYRNATICYKDAKIFNLRVKEFRSIYGYEEKKNRDIVYHKYDKVFQLPELSTTGTVIFHPSLNNQGVKVSDIAQILFETFLQRNAFDRNDINFIGNKLFYINDEFKHGEKFVALYDINPLNITSRIVDSTLIKELFRFLYDYIDSIVPTICPDINEPTKDAIIQLCKTILENQEDVEYKEVGNDYFYENFTDILYLGDEEEDLQEPVYAKFLGRGNVENTCNIMLADGQFLSNVSVTRIKETENTRFAHI